MPLQPGQVLNNRYRIVRLLGQGGFGAVYRAWDTNLNRPCAVKENMDVSPEAQRQFTREATVLANLSHPNLPRVTDHFILPGQGQYLVMDFVEGEDLASVVKREGSIPLDQALSWINQVADALSYLHNRQPPVVHRDVKPANIRLTPDDRAMLVDFGLVKLYDPHLHTTLGARAVTPGYAPPEQYGQGKTDSRTDQYALAATLYNLLTGQEPMESVQRMAGGQMRLAHQVNPRVNPAVGMAVERAMRLEPSQRFATVNEFKQALTVSTSPGVVARQGQEVYVRPLTPVAATQLAPSMPAASAQAPARAHAPAYPTRAPAQPKTGGLPTVGIGVGVVVLLCIGLALLLGVIANNSRQNAQNTTEAQLQATLDERVRTTSTAQMYATQTGEVYASQTAVAQATASAIAQVTANAQTTVDARNAFLASLDSSKSLVFGPASGKLDHEPTDGLIATYDPGVNLADFIVEVRFFNPYPTSVGTWDMGLLMRDDPNVKNTQIRFVILSDKSWELENISGDPDKGVILGKGTAPGLNVDGNGSNLIKFIAKGNQGWFFLNDQFITQFDLSSRTNSGPVYIGTGFYKDDEVKGYATGYTDFNIWSLP